MCLSLGSLFGARYFARLHISGMSFSYCPSEVIKRRTPIYPMPPMFSRFISCNADRLSNLLPTAIDHYIFYFVTAFGDPTLELQTLGQSRHETSILILILYPAQCDMPFTCTYSCP